MSSAPAKSDRLNQLDILRVIALFLVLGNHKLLIPLWTQVGWVGVDLFFVLSGFLVGGSLFREYSRHHTIDFKSFLLRRALRIIPPFYALLMGTIAYSTIVSRGRFTNIRLASEFFFFQNYAPPMWNHTWYLAVDVHFYLLLAIVLWVMMWRSPNSENPFRAILKLFIAVAVVSLILRLFTAYFYPYSHETHKAPTHLRLDSPLFGVVLGYCYHYYYVPLSKVVKKHLKLILVTSLLLISTCFFLPVETSAWMHTFGFTSLYLGFGGLLLFTLYYTPQIPDAVKPLATLGNHFIAVIAAHSYSIYLWHMFVATWGIHWVSQLYPMGLKQNVAFAFYFFGSITLGICMSKLIEVPTQTLRNRLFPSQART